MGIWGRLVSINASKVLLWRGWGGREKKLHFRFSAPVTREPGRAPPRHAHGDLTSLAPHERLPEILVVPRAQNHFGELPRWRQW